MFSAGNGDCELLQRRTLHDLLRVQDKTDSGNATREFDRTCLSLFQCYFTPTIPSTYNAHVSNCAVSRIWASFPTGEVGCTAVSSTRSLKRWRVLKSLPMAVVIRVLRIFFDRLPSSLSSPYTWSHHFVEYGRTKSWIARKRVRSQNSKNTSSASTSTSSGR